MSAEGDPPVEIASNGKPLESVWDFPRPPRLERVDWRVRVVVAGVTIVDSTVAVRALETSQAPAYYVPSADVEHEYLRPNSGPTTLCEWKGFASYADIVVGDRRVERAGWTYPEPTPAFTSLSRHWAFYAQRVDECWVDDERVESNAGDFYGGWITANVTGPFKGAPGTRHW